MGITHVTRGGAAFVSPASTPANETWRYQITLPFQVAPRLAAAFCNIRKVYAVGVDFEAGVDVVFFDSLDGVHSRPAVPLTRNHEEPNPHTKPPNAPAVMVKYPARGGFVPFGARQANGAAHPHAGTGFALLQALAWPLHVDATPPYTVYDYAGDETHAYFEVFQLAYDGAAFRVTDSARYPYAHLLPGWYMADGAMTNAIPDGDDFLVGMTGGKLGPGMTHVRGGQIRGGGAGVMRWRRQSGGWRPVDFAPVPDSADSFEPSLIRDEDGALLFCARGTSEADRQDIRVWRSGDGGDSWTKILHWRGLISSAPISINRAADGAPYVAADLYQVYMHGWTPTLRAPKDAQGRVRGGGWMRETLCLWPLTADRTGLDAPIVIRDCRGEFGPPFHGSEWRADHPSAATVQLADGDWHNVLGYRITELAELTHGSGPTPHTGAYLAEVVSSGPPLPAWHF